MIVSIAIVEQQAQHGLQLLDGERFGKEHCHPGGKAFRHQTESPFGSDHHRGNSRQTFFRSHVTNDFEPFNMRHHHVNNDRFEIGVALEDAKRLTAIIHRDHYMPISLQGGSDQMPDDGIVIGQQDAL